MKEQKLVGQKAYPFLQMQKYANQAQKMKYCCLEEWTEGQLEGKVQVQGGWAAFSGNLKYQTNQKSDPQVRSFYNERECLTDPNVRPIKELCAFLQLAC